MILLNTQTIMTIVMTVCAVAAIIVAQGGLAIARATDRHLHYPSTAIQDVPLLLCFIIPMMTLTAAGSVTLSLCIAAILLGSIAAADAQRCVIPDVLVFSFAAIGIVAHPLDPQGCAVAATTACICLLGVGYLVWFVLARNGRHGVIGQGDFKMIAALGANVSTISLSFVVLEACILAIIYWALMLRQRNARIPFGTFMAFACATVPAWPPL